MKIFNWVHRRFHHNVVKDGSSPNMKDIESAINYTETRVLLEQDLLDGWKDGILTIGTFGFDPLSYLDQQKEEYYTENEEEDEEEDEFSIVTSDSETENDEENESELNPLVFTTLGQDFNGYNIDTTIVPKSSYDVDLPQMLEKVDNHDKGKTKRERITLADLFLADSDVKINLDSSKTLIHPSNKKPSLRAKNGLSFAKKLIPQVGEDSRPIKKLHQLMKRMLKRKIHPELASKVTKIDGEIKSCALELLTTNNEVDGIESVSLLPIQDAIV